MLRLLMFGLAAAGAYWWFTRFPEDKQQEEPKLPSGVRLVEEASEVAATVTPSTTAVKMPQAADKPKAPRPTATATKAATPKPSVPSKPGKAPSKRVDGKQDDLTEINGIGKTFAQRLNAAGITTFRGLAAQSPERLREITQAREFVDTHNWMVQARAKFSDED